MGDSLKMPIRISWAIGMGKCGQNSDCAFRLYVYACLWKCIHAELTKRLNDQRIVNVNIYITLFIIY